MAILRCLSIHVVLFFYNEKVSVKKGQIFNLLWFLNLPPFFVATDLELHGNEDWPRGSLEPNVRNETALAKWKRRLWSTSNYWEKEVFKEISDLIDAGKTYVNGKQIKLEYYLVDDYEHLFLINYLKIKV